MDKYRIIEIVVVAVTTMVTTAVVTRLSLRKEGSPGVTSALKARLTPKFKAYTALILNSAFGIYVCVSLYRLVNDPTQVMATRSDVFWIVVMMLSAMASIGNSAYFLGSLMGIYANEREQREYEMRRPVLEKARKLDDLIDRTLNVDAPSDPPKDSKP